MLSSPIVDQLNAKVRMSSEPWPDDATLYQPYEAEQILLAENASCLTVKAYLKMCNLPFDVRPCANAEFMSPGGRMTKLPFIKAGAFVLAEFEPIVNFIETKELAIGQWLNEEEKAEMRTYVSLVENIFTMAELYISYVDESVYSEVTIPRNGYVYPWPLNHLQNYLKRRQAMRVLKVYDWDDMSIDDVIEKVEKCCEALTAKLEVTDSKFFCSDKPCDLDAVVFGHLFTIITTNLPNNELAETVLKFKNLVTFCYFIEKTYFFKEI